MNVTSYYKEAAMSGLILQFAFNYTDDNRQKLKEFDTMKKLKNYLYSQNIVEKFAQFADSHGLRRRNLMIQKSHHLLERFIVSRIIYNMQNEQAWMEYINEDDPVIEQAVKVLDEGNAFPNPPAEDKVAFIEYNNSTTSLPYDNATRRVGSLLA